MKSPEKPSILNGLKPTWAGKFAYYCLPYRKRVMYENIDTVFGDRLTPEEKKRFAQCHYSHLMKLIGEVLAASWMNEAAMRKRVRTEGHEIALKAAEQGKGVLFLTGHFGSWEFASVGTVLHFERFRGRIHVLRKLIANKFIEKILFRRFYKAGLDVISKRNSLNRVLEALSKNDVVIFIMDQYARPGKDGIEVDFFGKKAGTFRSLAMVAGQTGAPVIPTYSYREKDGTHVMKFLEPLKWIEDPDTDREIYENTLQYNRALEQMVLKHPDQWLWVHRRWKVKR